MSIVMVLPRCRPVTFVQPSPWCPSFCAGLPGSPDSQTLAAAASKLPTNRDRVCQATNLSVLMNDAAYLHMERIGTKVHDAQVSSLRKCSCPASWHSSYLLILSTPLEITPFSPPYLFEEEASAAVRVRKAHCQVSTLLEEVHCVPYLAPWHSSCVMGSTTPQTAAFFVSTPEFIWLLSRCRQCRAEPGLVPI